jgi:acetyltransferase
LFQKAGIIRCYGREELIYVAGVLTYPKINGKNMAIITHAGGPAVMLTDILSKNGLKVPAINNPKKVELSEKLYPGSSVANPIDFLATGTAEQLGTIIDYCDTCFDEIDAMLVIFGSPGLFNVSAVYQVLNEKIETSKKPIFPILPSVVNVKKEISTFLDYGRFAFFDEVLFGKALTKVANTSHADSADIQHDKAIIKQLKFLVKEKKAYLAPGVIQNIFDVMQIPRVQETVVSCKTALIQIKNKMDFPVVMKVVGPVHKTDVGGVRLDIKNEKELKQNFESLMQIKEATGVLIQPMLSGIELYIGAKKESNFGHTIVFGLGGVFIEILKDIQIGLAPMNEEEILQSIKNLKAYPILKTYRGKEGINIEQFVKLIKKVSDLVINLPEIAELDINPLIADATNIIAVDARIRME